MTGAPSATGAGDTGGRPPPPGAAWRPDGPLLEVCDLRTHFATRAGPLRAVDGVSFHVGAGEVLGIVGESGCGKSATALSVMGLVQPPGRVVGGRVLFGGRDLLTLGKGELRAIRGRELAMIFQNPLAALNPLFPVGRQIAETIRAHERVGAREAGQRAAQLLELVGIADAPRRLRQYPFQLSGGMAQRVMIAIALCLRPRLLIADEPTTALDVTIQAQVLDLLLDLNRRFGTAIVLISHNFGVVAEICHRTVIMYAGRVVESGPTRELFADPLHPYTRALLRCIPDVEDERGAPSPLEGHPPDLRGAWSGCAFEPRCPDAVDRCRSRAPSVVEAAPGRFVRCVHHEGLA